MSLLRKDYLKQSKMKEEILELFKQLEIEVTTEYEGSNKYVVVKLLFEGEVISESYDMIV